MLGRTSLMRQWAMVAVWLVCATPVAVGSMAYAQSPTNRPNTRERAFDPSRRQAFRVSKGDVEVAFLEAQRCALCKSAYQLSFEVTDHSRGMLKRFTISDGPSQVDEIHILRGFRAAVLGRYQSNVEMVILVDLSAGSVVDKWLCFDPSVSPEGTYIAYRKVFPVHFTEGVSSVYLVYRTDRSPAVNRPGGAPLTDTVNVGVPIYPPGSTNVPGDNTHVDQAVQHQIASTGFFWAGEIKLAFADRAGGVNSIVIVDLSSGLDLPVVRVTSLEPTQILSPTSCREFRDSGRLHYGFHISNIEFLNASDNRIRVHVTYALPDCQGAPSLELSVR